MSDFHPCKKSKRVVETTRDEKKKEKHVDGARYAGAGEEDGGAGAVDARPLADGRGGGGGAGGAGGGAAVLIRNPVFEVAAVEFEGGAGDLHCAGNSSYRLIIHKPQRYRMDDAGGMGRSWRFRVLQYGDVLFFRDEGARYQQGWAAKKGREEGGSKGGLQPEERGGGSFGFTLRSGMSAWDIAAAFLERIEYDGSGEGMLRIKGTRKEDGLRTGMMVDSATTFPEATIRVGLSMLNVQSAVLSTPVPIAGPEVGGAWGFESYGSIMKDRVADKPQWAAVAMNHGYACLFCATHPRNPLKLNGDIIVMAKVAKASEDAVRKLLEETVRDEEAEYERALPELEEKGTLLDMELMCSDDDDDERFMWLLANTMVSPVVSIANFVPWNGRVTRALPDDFVFTLASCFVPYKSVAERR